MPSPRAFGSNALFFLSRCGKQLDDAFFCRSLYSASPIADTGCNRRQQKSSAMETQAKGFRVGTPDFLDVQNASMVGGGVGDTFGEDAATVDQTLIAWARIVASGSELLRDPRYNKGLAFIEEEQDRHYLRGLLPPSIISQELQVERVLQNVRSYKNPLEKYIALMDLQEKLAKSMATRL